MATIVLMLLSHFNAMKPMLIGYEWVDIEIQKSTLLLSWLINGYGVSGVYPEFWNSESLTYEWVKEHYNVNWTI